MYKKVLVPLDGSELAECALNHVKALVKEGSVKEVTLFTAVRVDTSWVELYGKNFNVEAMRKALLGSAMKYLAGLKDGLAREGIKVKTEVLEADGAAQGITDYARKRGSDLIVIATHGYTGMKKLMMGSVALSILHHSHMPVLLIRPEACRG
ncbi:MAG: universal stress protein [Deltaproteobacteria bacterium]|nr:universal stress protein [Deltaproteobacteria bacterium]